ncbi:MAG: PrsW family intramembrane metalloprotease [SAR202 cluster bacterium]|nr:PrsW family intramembrane metalloprotease [SAR202 cluster bacterium]
MAGLEPYYHTAPSDVPPPEAPPPSPLRPPRGGPPALAFAIALALLGGVFGIVAAIVQEAQAGILVAFVGAPIIEEFVKPSGVYALLVWWPHLLKNRLFTAALAACGGLAFGYIESLVYIKVYIVDPSPEYVLFRLTVTPAMHVTASFIFGMGINQGAIDSIHGKKPLLQGSRKWFIAAIILHALYNIGATIISVVFDVFSDEDFRFD